MDEYDEFGNWDADPDGKFNPSSMMVDQYILISMSLIELALGSPVIETEYLYSTADLQYSHDISKQDFYRILHRMQLEGMLKYVYIAKNKKIATYNYEAIKNNKDKYILGVVIEEHTGV